MWSLLLVQLALASQPTPAKWEFRDEAAFAGRSLLTFRAVEHRLEFVRSHVDVAAALSLRVSVVVCV